MLTIYKYPHPFVLTAIGLLMPIKPIHAIHAVHERTSSTVHSMPPLQGAPGRRLCASGRQDHAAVEAERLLTPALHDHPLLAVLVGVDAADLALVALLDEAPEEAGAVDAEGRTEVGVDTEVVLEAGAESQAVGSHKVRLHLLLADQAIPVQRAIKKRWSRQSTAMA